MSEEVEILFCKNCRMEYEEGESDSDFPELFCSFQCEVMYWGDNDEEG